MATHENSFGNGLQRQSDENGEQLANGLGWFSIGLGLAEFAMPGKFARFIGIPDNDRSLSVIRLYGVRELAAGIGILSQPRPGGWLWARVAGDIVDLASLGSAMTDGNADRTKLATATAAVLGVTALDILCAQRLSGNGKTRGGAGNTPEQRSGKGEVRLTQTIIINRSAEELYRFWHDFNNLPSFMAHLASVEVTGDNRSHWVANGPGGKKVEWDAEIVEDQPNSHIAWRSLPDSDVDNAGSVRFERAPGDRGTLVKVQIEYAPPGGALGAKIAKLFREEPGQKVEDDLRAFKQLMETGEVAKSDASIHRGMHAAQPSAAAATA